MHLRNIVISVATHKVPSPNTEHLLVFKGQMKALEYGNGLVHSLSVNLPSSQSNEHLFQ